MKHSLTCLRFLACACCPACFEKGEGDLCGFHLKEANQYGSLNEAAAATIQTEERIPILVSCI